MIEGIGIDVVEVSRFRRAIEKWGDNLLQKIFTDVEIGYSNSKFHPEQHFAARFAVKEAVVKASAGMGMRPFRWKDIQTSNDSLGKPYVKLKGDFAKIMENKRIHVSISHTERVVVAVAVIEV